ncbi:HYC_CC_PP family protein [Flavihumibacter fluvii]|uniref:HYC_CC_PP family protein n=1 Tax=Flavihumibacter fluvii TaxID=2838157 RepID=UPI001EFAC84F|nr:hypothetical protein [Flavihumibacter fluvii]ULQ53541.1 hypothetical protein KJS93_04305 [Flavihumibacter fluvii]
MKKVLAISLALIYLLVSSGVLLEIHHCMGRIANAGLTMVATSVNDECGQCGMQKSTTGKHCCKDEYKQVKITIDQKPSSLIYTVDAPLVAVLTMGWPHVNYQPAFAESIPAYHSHAPPPLLPNRQSLFCVFLI